MKGPLLGTTNDEYNAWYKYDYPSIVNWIHLDIIQTQFSHALNSLSKYTSMEHLHACTYYLLLLFYSPIDMTRRVFYA